MLKIKKTFLVGGGDNEESVLNKKIIKKKVKKGKRNS